MGEREAEEKGSCGHCGEECRCPCPRTSGRRVLVVDAVDLTLPPSIETTAERRPWRKRTSLRTARAGGREGGMVDPSHFEARKTQV